MLRNLIAADAVSYVDVEWMTTLLSYLPIAIFTANPTAPSNHMSRLASCSEPCQTASQRLLATATAALTRQREACAGAYATVARIDTQLAQIQKVAICDFQSFVWTRACLWLSMNTYRYIYIYIYIYMCVCVCACVCVDVCLS